MENKSIVLLRSLMSLSLILIGVGIWLYISDENKKEKTPEPEEIKEEVLDINSDLVKKLPYPDMSEDCRSIEDIGRYSENFTVTDIELSEKIDTAFKALSTDVTETVPATNIREYVKSYWGEVSDYRDFSFSRNETTYTYNEEDQTYQITTLEVDKLKVCSVGGYEKHYFSAPVKALKKEKEITVDFVLLYYIEDINKEGNIIYHLYKDSSFTKYIETLQDEDEALLKAVIQYQADLEHYTFRFEEENGYHFKEAKKANTVSSLVEVEEKDASINPLIIDDLCIDLESTMYQKENFNVADLEVEQRYFLAFYHANKNDQLQNELMINGNRKEYTFTLEEAKAIYGNYWLTEDELKDFEKLGYQGTVSETEYKLVIDERSQSCSTTRQYAETKLNHIYQDGNQLYVDYKIRFVDQKRNVINIYQDKNFENVLQENIKSTDISEDYWDLNYVTYRYVYEKQENGSFYFKEGFYI